MPHVVRNGICFFEGRANGTAWTFPEGVRPAREHYFTGMTVDHGAATVLLSPDGSFRVDLGKGPDVFVSGAFRVG